MAPSSVTLALVASVPGTNPATQALDQCNPGGLPLGSVPAATAASGMMAWGTTLEPGSLLGQFSPIPVGFKYGSVWPQGVHTAKQSPSPLKA